MNNTRSSRTGIACRSARSPAAPFPATRQRLLLGLLVLLLPFLLVAQGMAQDVDLDDLEEYSYEYYYPKRAKGEQPTAWHVPDFDSINLFNGNLNLSIPIGPPLQPAADLSWQPMLSYSSKIWSDMRRDDRADPTNGHSYHAYGIENRGYLESDRTAGLGWRLAAPYLHLKRIKLELYSRSAAVQLPPSNDPAVWYDAFYVTACASNDACVRYLVDSIVMPDGSRHSLRPGREGWNQTSPPDDTNLTWYAADGSGWKVTRIDRSPPELTTCPEATPVANQTLDMWDYFIAEKDGLRYTFAFPFDIDLTQPANFQARETDFIAGTRGWYCTKIESQRWPDAAIEISYNEVNSPHPCGTQEAWKWIAGPPGDLDAPIISTVEASVNGVTVQELTVATDTLTGTIDDLAITDADCESSTTDDVTVIRSLTFAAVDGGVATNLLTYSLQYLGEATSGPTLYTMPITGKSRADYQWAADFSDHIHYSGHSLPPAWESIRSLTHPFPLLEKLSISTADTSIAPLEWSFAYDWTNIWQAPNAPPATDCTCTMSEAGYIAGTTDWDRLYTSDDRTGLVSQVTLPNGTTVDYELSRWLMAKQEFVGKPGRVKSDEIFIEKTSARKAAEERVSSAETWDATDTKTTEDPPTFGRLIYKDRSATAGVNRRLVTDTDGTTLELTEYIHAGLDCPHLPQLPDWDATVEQTTAFWQFMETWFQMLDMRSDELAPPQVGFPFDFAGIHNTTGDAFPDDLTKEFGGGYSQTVVRRHLIADADPPVNADTDDIGITDLTITTDLPSYRFDDTVHLFSNGSFYFDASGDGHVSWGDYFGNLPLAGRPLQVRYYRGNAMCRGDEATCDGDQFKWWQETATQVGELNLLRVDRSQYTLPVQDTMPPALDDPPQSPPVQHYPLRELCGPTYQVSASGYPFGMDLGYYCDAFAHPVRQRRTSTEYARADATADPRYSAAEYAYETDQAFAGLYSEAFDENLVLTSTVDDFLVERPFGATWDGTEWTVTTEVSYKKDHFDSYLEPWYPSLITAQTTTLSPPAATSSTEATSYSHSCVNGSCLLMSKTASASGDGADVTTWYDYYTSPADADRYGLVKLVTTGSSTTVGEPPNQETRSSLDITALDYAHQRLSRQWKLCAGLSSCSAMQESCDGWSIDPAAPTWTDPTSWCGGSYSLPAELVGAQSIDPLWRRPVSRTDANGDGVSLAYDGLGRLTDLIPTDSGVAATAIEYPDLRTSLVSIEHANQVMSLVARHSFDGLGRISHSAARREATTDQGYSGHESDFRHKVYAYDGAGSTWAESHWHAWQPGLLALPTGLTAVNEHFELTAVVDPFGRTEQSISATGSLTEAGYRGDQYIDTLVWDPGTGGSALTRTISRTDVLGNLVKGWEAKTAAALSTQLSGEIESTLDDTALFVRSGYHYDVGKRLLDVTVTGRAADGISESAQLRSFTYDGLGNLTRELYPELGGGWIDYSGFDVRGEPRLVQYRDAGGTLDTALFHERDAAGRPTHTWFASGGDWLLYSSNLWGTAAIDHEIGKLVESTQYNLLQSTVTACAANPVQAEGSIVVTHGYSYDDPLGLLSDRSTSISVGCNGSGGSLQTSLGYEHDRWGNISAIDYPVWDLIGPECDHPPRPTVSYTWDLVGGLSQIDLSQGLLSAQLLHSVQYDTASGLMTSWQTPVGLQGSTTSLSHAVTPDGTRARPLAISATLGGSPIFDSGTYSYNGAGSITGMAGSAVTAPWSYQYDALSRLTQATSGSSRQYQYDDFGNLSSLAGVALPVSAATNRLNGTGYAYDSRGNLETQPIDSTLGWSRQLRFDPGNRVVAAWSTPMLAEGFFGFAYDSGGERVLKYHLQQPGDETTREVMDATIFLRDESGNVLTEYQWLPTGAGSDGDLLRLADHLYLGRDEIVSLQPVPGASQGEWTASFTSLVHDHLSSTRAEVMDSSSWTTIDYWPFGAFKQVQTVGSGSLANNRRYFTGHEREYVGTADDFNPTQGLDYLHARYYSPVVGRFFSVDPKVGSFGDAGSWNRFSYVRNSPLKAIDPLGLEDIVVSGQPGDHKNREHFLINGLDRARRLAASGEGVTWIIYNEGGSGGFSNELVKKYTALAAKHGINLKVESNVDNIVSYINNKDGGGSRSNDLVTDFYYFGHATPGDLDIGFVDHGFWNMATNTTLDVGEFNAGAFSKGSAANLVGGCRTGIAGSFFGRSVAEQMADKVGGEVLASSTRVYYSGGVVSDEDLVAHENGEIITVDGRGGSR